MELHLVRTYHPLGTNGNLLVAGKRICFTIELPWKNNQRQISCIPEGKYSLRKRYTQRFGWHLLVENVSGRSGILIHAANDALKEIKGCIAPATELVGPGKGILSRIALKKLLTIVSPALDNGKPLFLIVKDAKNENNS
ncbi:MAG: hypothetical protein IPI78_07705 [Chitinophagaceae bacterium]|nr:hypothetical protein [Chitinophagaceae bacterium]